MPIISRPATKEYRDNFDATFGRKTKRRIFQLSDEAVKTLKGYVTLPFMCVAGRTPDQLIQSYWEQLAHEMGFDVDSVEDMNQTDHTFSAITSID